MRYRRLGNAGVKVSVLSFGSWVTFGSQLQDADDTALASLQAAWERGCNFFDNAEAYGGGKSEEIMGRALARLGWHRSSYLVSTKFYWGLTDGPNSRNTLNRKYLLEAIDGSLERFGLDHVDLVFCHRADSDTPIEETVWAMSDMVSSGRAHYWGTSEWAADEIWAAVEIAERHHLHKPVMEQPQYNLLHRSRVENEYRRVFDDLGYGSTTWSPLASGLLTGKYNDGVPDDSRLALPGYEWLRDQLTDPEAIATVRALASIAERLDCSLAQLAIAWCTKNTDVSTVITGASRASQVEHNFDSLEVADALTDDVMAEIDAIVS